MKTRPRRNPATKVATSRWLAYATASAATVLTSAGSADAEIHYSGRLDVNFGPDENKTVNFALDKPGDLLRFGHYAGPGGTAFFEIDGIRSEAFLGYSGFEYAYPAKLHLKNRYISQGRNFVTFYNHGTLYANHGRGYGEWGGRVRGFIGFRFDGGAGPQYGWARVYMLGDEASFILLDYAYADPGEPIQPGQKTSSAKDAVTEEGSLGLLAIGGAGLMLWRQRRRRAAA